MRIADSDGLEKWQLLQGGVALSLVSLPLLPLRAGLMKSLGEDTDGAQSSPVALFSSSAQPERTRLFRRCGCLCRQ